MIECPGWAAKKVNSQAQRRRKSKEVRAMDRWEQSPIYAASQDPQEVERSPFWGQRSRSQNRFPRKLLMAQVARKAIESKRKQELSIEMFSHLCIREFSYSQ
jgi:hypothetical protein